MPDPADTPEESERQTYRIWDWDPEGRVVQLEATVDLFYLPVGHPENKKPFPRPEFNLVALKTLEGQDYAFSEQLRRSIYLAIDTRIQEEFFAGLEVEGTEAERSEPEIALAGPEAGAEGQRPERRESPEHRGEDDLGSKPEDRGQDAVQKKGRGRGR